MKIGIIGSGQVAQILGNGLLGKGHQVKLGTRSPEKLAEWQSKAQGEATVGSFADAAEFGEVVFLCTLGNVAKDAVSLAGTEKFANKVVIDVTNPLDFSQGFPPKLTSSPGNSVTDIIQNFIPEAKVVKAFNTINANIMINAKMAEGTPTLFISGDSPEAKETVKNIAEGFGWEVEDFGGAANSYWLEANAMLWILWGAKNSHWTHAFKLLKK
jgi:predicted dinucleotide-binding enzyme